MLKHEDSHLFCLSDIYPPTGVYHRDIGKHINTIM